MHMMSGKVCHENVSYFGSVDHDLIVVASSKVSDVLMTYFQTVFAAAVRM